MALPLKYNFRCVLVRWRSTVATTLGIALVVSVFILLRALAGGIEKTNANTGDPRNILVVRKGSQAESGSLVSREQFRTLQYFEEIARNDKDEPIISAELVLIVSAARRNGSGDANTLVRGITPRGQELRPQVKLTDGRWFSPGQREVI
ncbi:MAG: ABC transporter permease, partial [Planctomycetaceae bacterium]|nr:ABC transporter permease [Planctomycetaceae bacterium]